MYDRPDLTSDVEYILHQLYRALSIDAKLLNVLDRENLKRFEYTYRQDYSHMFLLTTLVFNQPHSRCTLEISNPTAQRWHVKLTADNTSVCTNSPDVLHAALVDFFNGKQHKQQEQEKLKIAPQRIVEL